MSLILDALKKSEQERRRERGPDLQTIHQASPLAAHSSRVRWAWLALILVNAGLIGAWWWTQHGSAPSQQEAVAAAPAPVEREQSAPPATAAPAPVSTQPSTPPAPEADAQFTRIEPRAPAPRLDASTPVEEFTDLPPDVRSGLPAMTFSFHVYSADARNRTIIINNQRLREGDEVGAGVVLQEITEDGVILAMDHRRVHINVLTGW